MGALNYKLALLRIDAAAAGDGGPFSCSSLPLCVEALKKVSSPQIEEVKARVWSHFQLNHRKVNFETKSQM